MSSLPEAASRRNKYQHHDPAADDFTQLTRGGKLIHHRTLHSISLSNAIAAAIGIETVPGER